MFVPMSLSSGRTEHSRRGTAPCREVTRRRGSASRAVQRDAAGLTVEERQVVEDETRLAAVGRVLSLNGGLDSVLEHLTQLGSKSFDTPFAAVSFVERDRQVYKCAVGLPEPWRTRREIPLAYSYCKHVLAMRQPLIVGDARRSPLLRNNPSVRELSAIAYAGIPLITADGHVLGTFNVIDRRARAWSPGELDEMTELTAAVMGEIEQALAAAANAQRLERALRTHHDKLAMVVHDLRNYLNVISLGASLLAEEETGPAERDRDLQRIRTSAQQMDRMIQDLLDAARLEDGSFPLRRTEVVADGPLAEAAALMRPLAARNGIMLVADAGAAGAQVNADRDALSRVLSNLIGNAIKFTPQGGTITVWTRNVGHEVIFAVSDTGPGIAACELDHVFDRFWQSRTHRVPGAGLGLAIARGLVEQHGGRIWVESRCGAGATFFFALPRAGPA